MRSRANQKVYIYVYILIIFISPIVSSRRFALDVIARLDLQSHRSVSKHAQNTQKIVSATPQERRRLEGVASYQNEGAVTDTSTFPSLFFSSINL